MSRRLPGLVLVGVLSLAGAGAMAQAEAERRLDAAIERLRAALGPETRLEIGNRRIDPVSGNATLTDVTIIEAGNRLSVPEVRLSGMEDARIGRAELLRTTYLAAAGGRGEVARVVLAGMPIPPAGKSLDFASLAFDAIEVEAARMTDPAKGAMSLGRLAIRDFTPQGLAAASLEGFEFRDAAADPQTLRLGRVNLEAVTLPITNQDFDPLAFRAGRIALEDAALRDPGNAVSIALGRITLRDWLPGRAATLSAEALRLEAPAGTMGALAFNLARFDASGVDAPNTLAAVMSGLQIPDPFPGTPQRVALEGLDAAWDGQPVMTLARLLSEGGLADGIAQGAVTAEGLRVTPPRGQADWLEGLGYREVAGGVEMRATTPRAGGMLEIEPFRVAWDQAGTVTLATRLDGIPGAPPPGSPVQPEATVAAFAEARLAGLTLTLRDQGLLGRLLAMQARSQRVPEERLREQWAQMAMAMPLPGERPPPRAQRGAPPPRQQAQPRQQPTRPAAPPPQQAAGKGEAAPQAAAPSLPPKMAAGMMAAGTPTPSQAAAPAARAPAATAAPAPSPAPAAPVADRIGPMRQALASFVRQPGTLEITVRPAQPISFVEISGLAGIGPEQAAERLGLSIVAR